MNLYDAAYCGIAPFFLASARYKQWRHGKYRRSLPGMFGGNLPGTPLPTTKHRVWLHSVSVGETVAAGAFFRLLREARPDWEYLSTTTTETGQDQAVRSLAEADHHDFAPMDFSWVVRRFFDAYRPSVYLYFETEIWPNILLECGRRGIPTFMINGKLSEKSARWYQFASPIFRKPLGSVSAFLMQTRSDADRMQRIAGPDASIHVTGNVKFDNLPEPLSDEDRRQLRAGLGVTTDQLLFLAGSTHPGEERAVYTAFANYLKHDGPMARLVIAPRHPERFNEVHAELERMGAIVCRASTERVPGPDDVVLLDRMGVLARTFGAADIALVGGAWKPIGGHNLLEPAAHGVPVLHGPHMHAQKEIMRIMNAHKASRAVPIELLDEALLSLATSPETRRELGTNGLKASRANRGAAHRSLKIVLDSLDLPDKV